MVSNSFWSMLSRDRLPDCPFCTDEHEMEESRQLLGAWHCPRCNTTFKLSKDELEPVYDFDAQLEFSRRRACFNPAPYNVEEQGVGGLCRSCQHNQTIIIQLLASYDPHPNSSSVSFESLASQYRRDLERRYPLCAACKQYVDQKLSSISNRLKTRKLAPAKISGSAKLSQVEEMGRTFSRKSRSVSFALFTLAFDAFFACRKLSLIPHFSVLESFVPKRYSNAFQLAKGFASTFDSVLYKQLGVVIGVMGLFGLVEGIQLGCWNTLLSVASTFLRFALFQKGIQDGQMEKIMAALILLIDISSLMGDRKVSKRPRPASSLPASVSEASSPALPRTTSLPMSTIQISHQKAERLPLAKADSASPSKTIAHDFMEIDFGLGSNPQFSKQPSPFVPSFSSFALPSSERKSIFRPSRLDPEKAVSSMINAPARAEPKAPSPYSSIPALRPSNLNLPDRSNGLENVIGAFSLRDDRRKHTSSMEQVTTTIASFSLSSFGIYGQIALSVFFVGLRMMSRDRLVLITIVLLAAGCIRGPVWPLLPQQYKIGYAAAVVGRLACVAAQLSEPDFAELTLDSLLLRLLFLFIDLAILAAR